MRRRDRLRLQQFADLAPARRTLTGQLGIATEVRRVAVLNGPYKNMPVWDEQARVYSDNHLYRASITLPHLPYRFATTIDSTTEK